MTEKSKNYLDLLNNEQRIAVENVNGSILVLAGAGSGKTRVLTFKLLHLLIKKLATPNQIIAVTFTNKAASEMKQRISSMINFPIDKMWIGTFHSLCLRILKSNYEKLGLKSNFIIIDTEDQNKLMKQICDREKIDTKENSTKYFLSIIDGLKNKGISYDEINQSRLYKNDLEIKKIYKIYQEELIRLNCVDFGDLILYCIKLFKSNKNILENYQKLFKFILVDEYQDINFIQQKWLEYIYQGHKNICCVGDDDQSIYSWRGADILNLLNFEKKFDNSKIIRLEQNYRSTKKILECATNLISKNKGRYGKKLWSQNEGGDNIEINGFWETKEEAFFVSDKIEKLIKSKISFSQIAILFRVAAHTRTFEERLISIGLPYKIIGGLRFYERKEIKDAIAYLRIVNNLSDNLAFERIINIPKRGIGKLTLSKISSIARINQISMFEAANEYINSENSKNTEKIYEFIQNVIKWRKIKQKFSHIELAKIILEDSSYIEYLKQEEKKSNNPENLNRLDNINEFIESLKDFENLEGFLEHVGLVMENISNTSSDTISLMTMHAAKGLEFDYLFLAGWEEGVFPSQRSIEEQGQKGLEEERRLAYVAITRAKKNINITYVNQNRYSYLSHDFNMPSRFISELPKELINITDSSYVSENNFLEEFVEIDSISPEYITPGRKRLIENSTKKNIDWDFNQDFEIEHSLKIGGKVFHQKFGYGTILSLEGDKATINFSKASIQKVFIKYLQVSH